MIATICLQPVFQFKSPKDGSNSVVVAEVRIHPDVSLIWVEILVTAALQQMYLNQALSSSTKMTFLAIAVTQIFSLALDEAKIGYYE